MKCLFIIIGTLGIYQSAFASCCYRNGHRVCGRTCDSVTMEIKGIKDENEIQVYLPSQDKVIKMMCCREHVCCKGRCCL